ncbi:hypothetical protein GDO81_027399 [Engystomops pustulosus]|uniref:Uncharacterized protein n=1 Tax=Engystomops pustulosus TaxID=76066 RepID=A0AAV6YFV4_ENGPU|nr:hypothetical protein GDO81_027399 [Engystomops pustulosus]
MKVFRVIWPPLYLEADRRWTDLFVGVTEGKVSGRDQQAPSSSCLCTLSTSQVTDREETHLWISQDRTDGQQQRRTDARKITCE